MISNFFSLQCGMGGCLTELSIQLAVVMVVMQAKSIVTKIRPHIYKYYSISTVPLRMDDVRKAGQRWLRDLKLLEWGPQSLFYEYLEMVLQYGFVTMFVAAFPLAPLFALMNNIFEIRFDAKKMLQFHRRPVTQRVQSIGVWYRILDCIGKLSVITNGFIIAFSSEFIPRTVHMIYNNYTLDNYLNESLSYFNTSDFPVDKRPISRAVNYTTVCRYSDYRFNGTKLIDPRTNENLAYVHTYLYWLILAIRLVFVLVFEVKVNLLLKVLTAL